MSKDYTLNFDKIAEKIELMLEKFEQMGVEEREEFLKSNFTEKIKKEE